MKEDRLGLLYGTLCYVIWGLFPLYWRMLRHVDSMEILAHRMLWAAVFMIGVVSLKRIKMAPIVKNPKQCLLLLVASILISFNWGLYIWAINHGYILQSSIGYYINPLVNVFLGMVFLHERLNSAQKTAILFAIIGVLYFTIDYGQFPLISVGLALSFGLYGLLKKLMRLPATQALTMETVWMTPIALIYILLMYKGGQSALNTFDFGTWTLLLLAGAVTAIPLLLYGKAAERISLSALGFLQYLSPTGQFLIGIFVYGESFSKAHIVCFSCIWIGLVIFSIDMVKNIHHKQ